MDHILSVLIAKRNTEQIRATDQYFSGVIEKRKNRKLDSLHTDTDADEDAFVTVFVGTSSLDIKKAKTLRDDLFVPLDPEQLQVVFDLCQSEARTTTCTPCGTPSISDIYFTVDWSFAWLILHQTRCSGAVLPNQFLWGSPRLEYAAHACSFHMSVELWGWCES